MDGEQRREALLQMLGDAREPLSGSALARRLGAVSYTHLDVYKRQSPSCAAEALAFVMESM